MPRHPHEPVTPTLPFPPMPPAPPCGCTPPRMRPEPFSPGGLPAPHGFDFGRWAREKINWLLSLVPSAASPDNLLADREWVAGQAVGGKADKVADAAEGNLAALTQDGNLADSGAKPSDFATSEQGAKADTAVQPEGIAGFVDGAEYDAEYGDPPKPTILLKHGDEVVATVDAADFVIDGMVSNVEVKNGYLVITFNTDSGKQPISIPLTDIFNPDNYYTKTDVNGLLAGKVPTSRTVNGKALSSDVTLTGADLAVSSTDATKISAALAGKLNNTTDTMSGSLTVSNSLTVGSRSGQPVGDCSVAEGINITASGTPSHAEGGDTFATGDYSHSEGRDTTASGSASHAEGEDTSADGDYSHSEGYDTTASGSSSHAEGRETEAKNDYEHAQGRRNLSHKASATFGHSGNTLASIGFGDTFEGSPEHKNAVETMQDGKTFIYGLGGYDGKNPTSSTDLAGVVNGKQDALSAQQRANIAAVSDALAFDATQSYAAGDPVVYNGTLYTFTATHTGAWTGSDVSAVDIISRLAGKLDKSGGTFGATTISLADEGIAVSDTQSSNLTLLSSSYNFLVHRDGLGVRYFAAPSTSGTLALTSDLLAKLDSTSAAPAFSSDSTVQYAVGAHVTYNGKLYKCTTATTGGTWVAGSWDDDTMTDPDAVLDITAQNQLRVVAKDGTLLWAQGYDLASTSSATLACDAANNFTFADGATTQAFTLPTAPTGKVGDFGLDIDNSANTGAATMTLTGLDTAFSVVIPEGESLNDMLSIAAGELAQFYITMSTFRVNNLPTWHIVKQVVENGGATV